MKATTPNDIRTPGLGKVPAGSYLITGLPRIRSAWLAAVLCRDDFPVVHEAPPKHYPLKMKQSFGLIDPGAACLYPNLALKAFNRSTIIVIDRSAVSSRRSLERLLGGPAGNWQAIEERYRYFCASVQTAKVYSFKALDEYSVVNEISVVCTGFDLSRDRFDLFQTLRVEQDFVKAAKREQATRAA